VIVGPRSGPRNSATAALGAASTKPAGGTTLEATASGRSSPVCSVRRQPPRPPNELMPARQTAGKREPSAGARVARRNSGMAGVLTAVVRVDRSVARQYV
jgi:hypothetical protein